MRVSWIEYGKNERIPSKINEHRDMLKTIKSRLWTMIGHILKNENYR
jgi:hypothetical protein